MNITYKNEIYSLKNLKRLLSEAPFFSSGISFINQWVSLQSVFIFKSSGSTGIVKNIEVSRNQILESVKLTTNALKLKTSDRSLVCLAPEYVATKMMLARCLILDMDIILVDPSSNPLAGLDENEQIDFASFVPLQVQQIIDSDNSDKLNKIRNVLIGGAPVSDVLTEKLNSFQNNIYHTYGMTETVSHIAMKCLSKKRSSPYFKCLSGIQITSNNDDCLVIKGSVTNNKEVITKDLVEIKNGNEFIWLGRQDNLVNSGGVKIIPEQIESLLKPIFKEVQMPNEFFLGGIKDPVLGQKLILIVEGTLPTTGFETLIKTKIEEFFSKYHVPKQTICLDQFIRTSSGKVKRSETLKLIN
ncbi:AMP-binding protein [Reichenbachiella sp. MALMAid0571]|uniref:AMP-binding protein n=1 Tax=Reichenbachiella sp. MALMAid0571 TaxID=3143939 RepID=UPI0032DF9393